MDLIYLYGVVTGFAISSLSYVVFKIFSKDGLKESKYQASIKVGQNYQSGIVTFREIK